MATSPDPNNTWRYPGPSTRYTRREVTRPAQHARFKSEYKVQGPVLSTELRAHRRALSSTTLPPSTPTAWRGGRPVSSSSSSIPSPSPQHPSSSTMSIPNTTPEKPRRRRSSDLRDSPFSDSCYFTEDDRSMAASGHASIPSATQSLIIRLSKLQAQLLREDPPHLFDIVARKLNEIETEVAGDLPPSSPMKDSGLFMDEEDTHATTPQAPAPIMLPESPAMSPVIEAQETQSTPDAESETSLREARDVLESVTKVQTELRQQLKELRALRAEMDLPEDDEISLQVASQLQLEDESLEDEDLEEQIVDEDIRPSFEEISFTTTKLNDEQDVHVKSAWRELWDGLTAFAGMDHDLDSDIDS